MVNDPELQRTSRMNAAYVTALAALAGSAIGGLSSFATTWLTQNYQERAQRAAAENTRREKLFGDFIDQASLLFVDAMTHEMDDPAKIVPLYAVASRIRLFAGPSTIRAAETVLAQILDLYYAPNVDFTTRQQVEGGSLDPLRSFTEACRSELR